MTGVLTAGPGPARRAEAQRQAQRQAQKQAQRQDRRHRWLRSAGAACLAGLLLAGGLSLTRSSVLDVDRVAVTGTARLSRAQVAAVVDVPLGTPLARVDLAAVRDRVARLAPVAQVDVQRGWPGTLTVRVTERTPAAVAELPDRRWRLVDGGGVPFAVARTVPRGAVRLNVQAPGPAGGHAPTVAALQVLAELPGGLRGRVDAVGASSASAVTLTLREDRTVVWGAPGSAAVKAAAVSALLRRPGRVIDVSSPTVVVVRD